jgi:hypothetical protein
MTRTTPQQFIDDIRSSSWFANGVQKDSVFVEHLAAIEYGIERTYELGNTDPIWLARFDELKAIIACDDLTIKERLLAIGRAFEPWQAERLRKRGH